MMFPLPCKFVFWNNYLLNAYDSLGHNIQHRWLGPKEILVAAS